MDKNDRTIVFRLVLTVIVLASAYAVAMDVWGPKVTQTPVPVVVPFPILLHR